MANFIDVINIMLAYILSITKGEYIQDCLPLGINTMGGSSLEIVEGPTPMEHFQKNSLIT